MGLGLWPQTAYHRCDKLPYMAFVLETSFRHYKATRRPDMLFFLKGFWLLLLVALWHLGVLCFPIWQLTFQIVSRLFSAFGVIALSLSIIFEAVVVFEILLSLHKSAKCCTLSLTDCLLLLSVAFKKRMLYLNAFVIL